MGEFASKGVAGAGLGTGIAGLSLGVLNSMGGVVGNWLGNRGVYNSCGCNDTVALLNELANRDSELAFYKSKAYSDESDLAIYKYFDGRIRGLEERMHANEVQQVAFNSNTTAAFSTLNAQVKELQGLVGSITRTAVPKSAICDFDNGCGCCGTTTV